LTSRAEAELQNRPFPEQIEFSHWSHCKGLIWSVEWISIWIWILGSRGQNCINQEAFCDGGRRYDDLTSISCPQGQYLLTRFAVYCPFIQPLLWCHYFPFTFSFWAGYLHSKWYAVFLCLPLPFIHLLLSERPFNGLLIFSLRSSKNTKSSICLPPIRRFDSHRRPNAISRPRGCSHICWRCCHNQEVRAVQQGVLWIWLNGSMRRRFGPKLECALTTSANAYLCIRHGRSFILSSAPAVRGQIEKTVYLFSS